METEPKARGTLRGYGGKSVFFFFFFLLRGFEMDEGKDVRCLEWSGL